MARHQFFTGRHVVCTLNEDGTVDMKLASDAMRDNFADWSDDLDVSIITIAADTTGNAAFHNVRHELWMAVGDLETLEIIDSEARKDIRKELERAQAAFDLIARKKSVESDIIIDLTDKAEEEVVEVKLADEDPDPTGDTYTSTCETMVETISAWARKKITSDECVGALWACKEIGGVGAEYEDIKAAATRLIGVVKVSHQA